MGKYDRYNFAQPTSRDVHPVNPVLTNLSIGFKNEKFLWESIAPVSSQNEKSGTFFVFDREFWFRRPTGIVRAAEAQYQREGYGVSTDTYATVEIGIEKALGDVTEAASQMGENLSTVDVQFLTNLIELELEKRVAAATFVTGVWGNETTLSGTGQWSDYANSDPIADTDTAMNTIRQNTGAAPTTLFMGISAWQKLKEHPLVLDKYKHTQTGIMTEDLVAAALGVPEIVVGDSVENTGDEGQVFSGSDIWTDSALYLVRNSPALGVANGCYTFMWNEKGNIPWAMDGYREDQTRSEVNRIFTHLDVKITSSQHGYLILDTIA